MGSLGGGELESQGIQKAKEEIVCGKVWNNKLSPVYGQFCIETLHKSRKRKSSGLFGQISTLT